MASTKCYDACVKIGTYTDRNGNEKGQYKNIGAVMRNEDGGHFMLIDATVISSQLFALINPDRQRSVIVSLFEQQNNGQDRATPQQGAQDGGGDMVVDDEDIPF